MPTDECSPQEWQMVDSIQAYISELTVDPEVRAKRLSDENRRHELCQLSPWNRYLEENPDLKQWVDANPGPAKTRVKKFMADPKHITNCDDYLKSKFFDVSKKL